ncbi:hypothetical protein B0H16DRAFT_1729639 [Mycena metata]|uniref:Uncharacterized protein n=1 Tax=Mycena metata TaxID=1033252 RepID=A0AAD7MYT3_9AGAR|nr:hypothetical protein B0H16DRAFT_1729639 [Mycena metata]
MRCYPGGILAPLFFGHSESTDAEDTHVHDHSILIDDNLPRRRSTCVQNIDFHPPFPNLCRVCGSASPRVARYVNQDSRRYDAAHWDRGVVHLKLVQFDRSIALHRDLYKKIIHMNAVRVFLKAMPQLDVCLATSAYAVPTQFASTNNLLPTCNTLSTMSSTIDTVVNYITTHI